MGQQQNRKTNWIKVLCSSFILFTFSSCLIIKTNGFYCGYSELSETDKQKIVFVDQNSSICSFVNRDAIYSITGKQLRSCLSKNDTSVVYLWGPNCSSENCILISACQRYCTSKKYNLYVVADYYDMYKMQVQNASDFPMLIANHQYYKKEYANALNRRFKDDLLNAVELKKDEDYHRFLIFKGDELIQSREALFEP